MLLYLFVFLLAAMAATLGFAYAAWGMKIFAAIYLGMVAVGAVVLWHESIFWAGAVGVIVGWAIVFISNEWWTETFHTIESLKE